MFLYSINTYEVPAIRVNTTKSTYTFTSVFIFTGSIQVTVDGPSKTDVKREEKGDKIICSYMPMSPGSYIISIKYKGKDIKGSPFNAKVSGKKVDHVVDLNQPIK